MKIQPLEDRVVIQPVSNDREEKIGSIYVPDTAKEKPCEGTVVAVGSGKQTDEGKTIPLTVKVKDKVLYSKYSGTEIKEDGKAYLIVRQSDILAILK